MQKTIVILVEDAAQAQGASYFGKPIGGFGEMACFSFYPGKNLGACGEAGGITTSNADYAKHLQSLRNHGSLVRYYHDEIGYNMRMGGLEGASLQIKLKYLPAWNQKRQKLQQNTCRDKERKIKMQWQPEGHNSVFHLFVITTENRDELTRYLNDKNIFPGLHYPVPCHLQKAYSGLGYKVGDFPNAEYLAAHCLSLPMYAELSSAEIDCVIKTLNSY